MPRSVTAKTPSRWVPSDAHSGLSYAPAIWATSGQVLPTGAEEWLVSGSTGCCVYAVDCHRQRKELGRVPGPHRS